MLKDALKSEDGEIRVWAAFALMRIDPDGLIRMADMLRMLKDEDILVRRAAIIALYELKAKGPDVVSACLNMLNDKSLSFPASWHNCCLAAEALGDIGPDAKEALPALEKVAAGEDKRLAGVAAEAIEKIKKASTKPSTQP